MASLPRKFGPFEPLRRLGVGGMAETFVAIRRGPAGFEQRVCIKRVLPAYEADQEFVRAFLSEARTSAALRHANIVQVLDFGLVEEEGSHYLALELVDGLDLRALLQSVGPLSPKLVVLVASEIAAALEYAHTSDDGRAEVVHRDVSPSNVLVSRAGEIKLTDFGIARVAGGAQHTATGVIKGKVPYMPPEYIEHGRFDARGDLFALGVMLFELLSGERPFDGESDLDTLRRIVSGVRRPLSVAAPAELVACIERLIATDISRRFASARDLLAALPAIPVNATRRELAELVRARTSSAPSDASTRPLPRAAEADAATERAPSSGRPARRAAESAERAGSASAPLSAQATRTRTRTLRPSRAALLALTVSGSLLAAVSVAVAWRVSRHAGASAPPALPIAPVPVISPRSVESAPSNAPALSEPPAPPEPREAPSPSPLEALPLGRPPASDEVLHEPTARAAKTRVTTAELKVVVVPFGDVWVDDKFLGQSPLTVRLPPGPHTVAVGEGRARERRSVVLTPGAHEQLVFRSDRGAP